jgi:hypothetical protein
MQHSDDGHAQIAQQREDVAAGWATEDAVLVLEDDKINSVDVQEVGGARIGFEVALGDLKTDARWVGIALLGVVDGNSKDVGFWGGSGEGFAEVGGEGGDAALSRQVVADDGDLAKS